ncbi:MAG: hypothetical protein M1536_02085 [Firmicutes bacterium]|nr:hypothetical protein [Bacillota bacterium]
MDILTFFVIIVIIFSFVGKAISGKVTVQSISSTESIQEMVSELRSANLSSIQPGAKPYITENIYRRHRPFPVNWDLIKLNLNPGQIKECFNVEALNSGNVKIEDLPNYVNIERLKEIFSEPQLRDMIDLDFFEAKEKKKAADFKTSRAPDFQAADKIADGRTAKKEVHDAAGVKLSENSVINGIIWKEILDVPLSRRVYGRR